MRRDDDEPVITSPSIGRRRGARLAVLFLCRDPNTLNPDQSAAARPTAVTDETLKGGLEAALSISATRPNGEFPGLSQTLAMVAKRPGTTDFQALLTI